MTDSEAVGAIVEMIDTFSTKWTPADEAIAIVGNREEHLVWRDQTVYNHERDIVLRKLFTLIDILLHNPPTDARLRHVEAFRSEMAAHLLKVADVIVQYREPPSP